MQLRRTRINQLAQVLQRELGSQFFVVPYPDHPEMSGGPEILVGGDGAQTAIFSLDAAIVGRCELEARLISGRLALPARTRFVGVVDSKNADQVNFIERHFDDVVDVRETSRITNLCRNSNLEGRRVEELRRVQRMHAVFSSSIHQITQLRRRRSLEAGNVASVLEELGAPAASHQGAASRVGSANESKGEDARNYPKARVGPVEVAGLNQANRRHSARQLVALCERAVVANFLLHDGVPEVRQLLPRILLVTQWPSSKNDPDKPLRVAAFSGWVTALATSSADIELLAERALESTRRRLNEHQ